MNELLDEVYKNQQNVDQLILYIEQTAAELGQAQLKLGLDFTLIFCRFGLVEIVIFTCKVRTCKIIHHTICCKQSRRTLLSF